MYMCTYIYVVACIHTYRLPIVTAGVVLHFKIPVIEDYYIIDPQRWFDLCSLVISPDNVSSLVRAAGRPGGNISYA